MIREGVNPTAIVLTLKAMKKEKLKAILPTG
jgi:hypothetical protein